MLTEIANLSIIINLLIIIPQYLHLQQRENYVKMLNSNHSQKALIINLEYLFTAIPETYFPSILQKNTSLQLYSKRIFLPYYKQVYIPIKCLLT